MRSVSWAYYLILIAILISGCDSKRSTYMPVQVPAMSATLQAKLPTLTEKPAQATPLPIASSTKQSTTPRISLSTQVTTETLPPTLEPEQAMDAIFAFLKGPEYCEAPCFLGIVPGKTTLNEAINIFVHLGLSIKNMTYQGKEIYGTHYNSESGLSIYGNLTIQDQIVRNLRIDIIPATSKAGTTREWLAYSPETLIKQYGMPSRVDFVVDWGPNLLFVMNIYFNEKDLIGEYSSTSITPNLENWSIKVCPLAVQFDDVRLWMGKDPINQPGQGVPLEQVTSMTLEEFSKLMTGDPKDACFIVNGDVFR